MIITGMASKLRLTTTKPTVARLVNTCQIQTSSAPIATNKKAAASPVAPADMV